MPQTIPPPGPDEYSDFHKGYIAAVAGETDAVAALARQRAEIDALRGLTDAKAGHRYAEGKWSVRDVIGHIADAERVFAYRLLRIARGDTTPLPGFDEVAFGAASNADRRALADLVDELATVREASLTLLRGLDENVLTRRGVVSDRPMSVRALAFVTAGHFRHHVNVLRERYGVEI